MSLFEAWFFGCGVVFTGILFIGLAWFLTRMLLWPIVETCSLTKCTVKALGEERRTSICTLWWRAFKDFFGGRDWDTIRTNRFEWNGVGNWKIYPEEDSHEQLSRKIYNQRTR